MRQISAKNIEKSIILTGLVRLQQDVIRQKEDEDIANEKFIEDFIGDLQDETLSVESPADITSMLKASIYYEQFKDNPAYAQNIQSLKSRFGKLDKDYNGLLPLSPVSENEEKIQEFKDAAAEYGFEVRPYSMYKKIGDVIVQIYSDHVLFVGIYATYRVETFSISKNQIMEALAETL